MGILTTVRGRQVINSQREREGGRERQREMYFQLFLLISPVLGMPNKAAEVGSEVVNELQSFIDFSKETGDLLDNSQWIKEVFVSLENTESSVLGLEVELKTMPHSNVTGLGLVDNYFPAYNEAKHYLRETEQKPRQFAYKTVAEVRDLKTLFAAVDESQDQAKRQDLFRFPIDKLTGFMRDTLEKLRGANEKYKTAKKTFVDLKNFSTQSKEKVEKMLITDSDEHQNWVKVVREAVRNASDVPEQVRTLEMELDDNLRRQVEREKDLKIKAKVVAKINAEKPTALKFAIDLIEGKIKNDIEFAIERYNAKLEKLKEVTVNMLESGGSFEKTIDKAMNILRKKITKIRMSTESANVVSENKDSPQQFLTKYQDIKTDLINGLDNMKNSAETFLSV